MLSFSLQDYIKNVNNKYTTRTASERTYYPVIEEFIKKIKQQVEVIIEPNGEKIINQIL